MPPFRVDLDDSFKILVKSSRTERLEKTREWEKYMKLARGFIGLRDKREAKLSESFGKMGGVCAHTDECCVSK